MRRSGIVLFVLLPQIVGAIWPNRPAYCLLVLCHPGATATLFESLTNHSFFRNFCWKTLTTFVICSGWALWWMGKITLKMQLKQFDPDTYLLPLIFCYPGPSVARKLKQILNSRFDFKQGSFHSLDVVYKSIHYIILFWLEAAQLSIKTGSRLKAMSIP